MYGVTSEGVSVFLNVALDELNVPKPFTVKLTGGPDGDVCGNMLYQLNRDYGDDVKVVGLADGTGCLEDPNGLDMPELLRFFEAGLPIEDYDASKISSEGALSLCDTDEGTHARNTMHNRVKADAFVPAGGRPGTINESNWKQYLNDDGTPSSPLIVEGANLFITHGARELLQEAGCVIVKDSSANKCGVICSSYEIMSSMQLSSDEFLDVKDELVEDVIVSLRRLARREAELLFRTRAAKPDASMQGISQDISACIIRASDSISRDLEGVDKAQLLDLLRTVREHMPTKLTENLSALIRTFRKRT